jgi:general secretion pathway protein D
MKKISALLLLTALFSVMQTNAFTQEDQQLTVKDYLEKALPPEEGRKIVYNEQAKLLTVTDTKTNHKLIRQLIEQFEIGQKQVVIEARFVEIDETDLWELGIEWDFYQDGNETSVYRNRSWFHKPTIDGTGTYHGVKWDDSTTVSFPKVGDLAGQLWISKVTSAGDYLTANLRALEQEGKANLLSAPKVTTVSGQMANIQVTRTYPYVSDFTLENIGTAEFPIWNYKLTLAEKPVGISLEVTPYVGEGTNTITLDLHPEVSVLKSQVRISNLTGTGATAGTPIISADLGWPVVDVRTTQTSIAVDSGETVILGGMIKDDEKITKRKVPILGDVPLLGKAFQYDYKNHRKINLLIFITASIMTADGDIVR